MIYFTFLNSPWPCHFKYGGGVNLTPPLAGIGLKSYNVPSRIAGIEGVLIETTTLPALPPCKCLGDADLLAVPENAKKV